MKRMVFGLVLGAIVTAFAGESADESGGMLTLWPKDHGRFLFINSQTRVEATVISTPVQSLVGSFNVDICVVEKKDDGFDVRKASAALRELGAKGGIWLVDDPDLPVTLVAPENDWGMINLAPLSADAPNAERLALRVQKFIFRTFANLHGISDPVMMPGCVMKQAVGIAGVDALICSTFSPEAQAKVSGYLAKAGYKQRKYGTYYDACEEGWAPAPTNAVQKAIWDKVHQLPTKPLTIKRESDRKDK